jgi:hypothetical protein
MNAMKGKRLCLHFDREQVKPIEDDLYSTVTVERIIISVTSSDWGDADDILLGVVQAVSSKGYTWVHLGSNPLRPLWSHGEDILMVCRPFS